MKTINITASFISLICISSICDAQTSFVQKKGQSHSLEERARKSNLIIEGHVLETKSFKSPQGNIYTSAVVRITKLFQGNVSDSLIEIILQGGQTDSVIVMITHNLGLEKGMEGIFLLRDNKTDVHFKKSLQSYLPAFGQRSYIEYHDKIHMVDHHVATCKGETYDDLESDLFRSLELITGHPRVVFAPNMFEKIAAKGNK